MAQPFHRQFIADAFDGQAAYTGTKSTDLHGIAVRVPSQDGKRVVVPGLDEALKRFFEH